MCSVGVHFSPELQHDHQSRSHYIFKFRTKAKEKLRNGKQVPQSDNINKAESPHPGINRVKCRTQPLKSIIIMAFRKIQ